MLGVLFSFGLHAVELGKVVPDIKLDGDIGGYLDGSPWSSADMRGKVHVYFYVDPDHKDRNNPFSDRLKKENFSSDYYQAVAIVNLKATWLPNFAVKAALREKQKEFPRTLYMYDRGRHLVKEWGLKDDESDILITGPDGKVLYFYFGELKQDEIEKAVEAIKIAIAEMKAQEKLEENQQKKVESSEG